MWNSANVDTSTRSEFEISAAAVKDFYGIDYGLYCDNALSAIVTGCVKEYSFIRIDMTFEGIVTSFEGIASYKVKIFVTDDFTIESASCTCPDEICHHIGALALHSGFRTPLFSYVPFKRKVNDDGATNSNGAVEGSDVTEIEFVKIKMENCDDYSVETGATNTGKNREPSKQPKSRVKFITTDHICRICNKMYADSHQLRIHEAKEHTPTVEPIKIQANACQICDKMFVNSYQLHIHRTKEHTVAVEPVSNSSTSS